MRFMLCALLAAITACEPLNPPATLDAPSVDDEPEIPTCAELGCNPIVTDRICAADHSMCSCVPPGAPRGTMPAKCTP